MLLFKIALHQECPQSWCQEIVIHHLCWCYVEINCVEFYQLYIQSKITIAITLYVMSWVTEYLILCYAVRMLIPKTIISTSTITCDKNIEIAGIVSHVLCQYRFDWLFDIKLKAVTIILTKVDILEPSGGNPTSY